MNKGSVRMLKMKTLAVVAFAVILGGCTTN